MSELESKYITIRVSSLRGDQKINFNTYLILNNKPILYCKKGDQFDSKRLSKLREKKLQKMYILETDEPQYLDYLNENLRRAYGDLSGKSLDQKVELVQGIQQAICEDLIENASEPDSYKLAIRGFNKFTHFLEKTPEAVKLFFNENSNNSLSQQGVCVSVMAYSIAKKMGLIESMKDKLQPFLLAASIANCQLQGVSDKIEIDPLKLSGKELLQFKNFILSNSNPFVRQEHIPPVVKEILDQQHEAVDGSGIPNALSAEEINPLALIVGLSSAITRYLVQENLTGKAALKKMLIEKMGIYPLPMIQALQRALKEFGFIQD